MAEYIERECLKDTLSRYLNAPHVRGGHSIGQGMRVAIKTCIEFLDEAPAAEVEPVGHGEWLLKHIGHGHYWECSKCHTNPCICVTENTKFCPNCGARMDGGAENV